MTLTVGKKAPNFSLTDKDDVVHVLNEVNSKYTLIFFYPKDSTPGCTIESVAMSKARNQFEKLGCTVIGISGGDNKTKEKFCDKFGIQIPMLSDTDNKVGTKYGVFGEKKFMGRTYNGYNRVSFLLDEHKKIIKVYEKVSPPTHTKEVLADLKEMEE